MSYHIVKGLVHTQYVALPNIVADRGLIPELLRDAVAPEGLTALLPAETREHADGDREATFATVHAELRRDASERAADAVPAAAKRSGE